MPFSKEVMEQAFARSKGRCECTRSDRPVTPSSGTVGSGGRPVYMSATFAGHKGVRGVPLHVGRCPRIFTRRGAWVARPIIHQSEGGPNALENCEVLCTTCAQLA